MIYLKLKGSYKQSEGFFYALDEKQEVSFLTLCVTNIDLKCSIDSAIFSKGFFSVTEKVSKAEFIQAHEIAQKRLENLLNNIVLE